LASLKSRGRWWMFQTRSPEADTTGLQGVNMTHAAGLQEEDRGGRRPVCRASVQPSPV